jgi:hypothetical protein
MYLSNHKHQKPKVEKNKTKIGGISENHRARQK